MTAVPLARRLLAEGLGTALLVAVVVGSGSAAASLSTDEGIRLFVNAAVTVAGLAVLILVLGPVSGAHFNPVVSVADWWLGRRHGTGLSPRDLLAYVPVQVVGAVAGALLADAMHGEDVGALSSTERTGGALLLSEVVATAGLLLVIVALVRSQRTAQVAWAVAAYIGAAYWFTASTSFANPAVSVGRVFTDTYAGIAPSSLAPFIVAQCVGGAVGVVLAVLLFPTSLPQDGLVVPETERSAA